MVRTKLGKKTFYPDCTDRYIKAWNTIYKDRVAMSSSLING
jgi:7-cyano-7-deazaguanine synthase in queuosine biosynthesis